jgi:hypothetical protein
MKKGRSQINAAKAESCCSFFIINPDTLERKMSRSNKENFSPI